MADRMSPFYRAWQRVQNKTLHVPLRRASFGRNIARLFSLFLLLFPLSACSGYDFDLDIPVLKAVGIDFSDKKMGEAKLEDSPPLVVPPSAQLRKPGKSAAQQQHSDWPDDPDIRAKKLAELKKQKAIKEGKYRGPWNKAINKSVEAGRGEPAGNQDGGEEEENYIDRRTRELISGPGS